ncbi:MAG: TrbI/VirB10 family protein [Candidatus Tectimicrobiota bacterium]
MQQTDPQHNGQTPPPPAPKQPWEPLALRARPAPVTRLNRKVIGLLLALGLGLVAFALSTGLKPPRAPAGPAEAAMPGQPTPPEALGRMPASYGDMPRPVVAQAATPPPAAPPPVPPSTSLPTPVVVRQPPPAPPSGPTPAELAAAEARRTAREAAEKARLSEIFFPSSSRSPVPPPAPERLQAALAGTPPAHQGAKSRDLVEKYFAPQAEKREFLAKAGKAGNTVLPHALQEPVSPYEVKAGTLIPAVLLTGINADLPGQLIAQVREPVYDTVTGHALLIPQGTRILGVYDSAVVTGQNRVLVVWSRLLFPNGTSLSLDGMPGVDLAGYAGFKDTVNHHYGTLIGAVALSSLLSLGTRLPFGSVDDSRLLPTLGQDYADQVGSNINRAGQQIVSRQLQQPPTIEIRPGFAVNVFVNADLVLRPYQAPGHTPN